MHAWIIMGNIYEQNIWMTMIIGQIFNDTQKRGGKLAGMGDLIQELQDVINEGSSGDIIDSFADFLQVNKQMTLHL